MSRLCCSEPFNAISVSCTIQKGISPKGTGEGDGLNDYFDLEGQNVSKLEIFNRYGTKVRQQHSHSWDLCRWVKMWELVCL
ncbi:MAG: gliding motility-associated C-terminal domain-containing protein [Flavobacterium sp.]|nr:gliding motility-associated C-terminal domain-containing protein [Flavobacterium sp.]